MTDKLRITIAAAATALFLAAVSAAGVIAHSSKLPAATTAVSHAVPSGQWLGARHLHPPPAWQDQEHD